MVAKRIARSERTQAINQARALIVTGPDDLHARFTRHATADLVAELAALRPRPGAVVGYHTRIALRAGPAAPSCPAARSSVSMRSSCLYRSRTCRRAVSWGFCRCARSPPSLCGMLAALRGATVGDGVVGAAG